LQEILASDDEIDRDKEHFWAICTNTRYSIISIELVSLGTLNQALASPREVYRRAISQGAAHVIIAHNHPSGNVEPSSEDLTLTKRLQEAGRILDIELQDHIILTDKEFLSLRQRGVIGDQIISSMIC
jgi:DNA repair protein RadC